ncbi:MAG TPA: DUF475 domain-containing protein [Candidatus Kaiserbacteria bacterium]|nr:DUF475 domain-containing protein [Candidatus Kaiserbacteria bacterium]
MKLLFTPVLISVVVLSIMYVWGGLPAFLITLALAVLEITFSFDNAVINARILEKMPLRWQQFFLTWGVLVSVGIVRFVLPVLIVSVVLALSPSTVAVLIFTEPAKYAVLIAAAEPAIKAFGGTFLLLIALRYFFNEKKDVHWFTIIERKFASWGQLEAINIALALSVLLLVAILSKHQSEIILESGLFGTVLFIAMEGVTRALGVEAKNVVHSGVAFFLYLSVLDMAFSLDSVVGAFAITTSVPVIVAGLGIGAYFVRTLTLMLVRGGTLKRMLYLENGAHWAIFALAICMFVALLTPLPEWFVASIGVMLIFFAYLSSKHVLVYELGDVGSGSSEEKSVL